MVVSLLRDLYGNKPRAVLREYHSNGYDAHVEAGKDTLPLSVTLPTHVSPTLLIRDFGSGLCEEDMFTLFPSFGASTKRDTNKQHGFMGVGCKAGHALVDVYHVTSWHGGFKKVYVAFLDESEMGLIDLVHASECDPDETGLEIKITVPMDEVTNFHTEAQFLFRFAEVKPDINIELTDITPQMTQGQGGFLLRGEPDWLAVMGGVPYEIKRDQLLNCVDERFHNSVKHISGVLQFNIGDVDIAPSREVLKFTKRTREKLGTALETLLDSYTEEAKRILADTTISQWQRRLDLRSWKTSLPHMPWPVGGQPYAASTIPLFSSQVVQDDQGEPILDAAGEVQRDTPVSFVMKGLTEVWRRGPKFDLTAANGITVSMKTSVLIHDANKSSKRYLDPELSPVICIIRDGYTREDVRAELDKLLLRSKVDGVPVTYTSDMEPLKKLTQRGARFNAKHHTRWFKLNRAHFYGKKSDSCTIVEDMDEIEEGSPVLFINRFEPCGMANYLFSKLVQRTWDLNDLQGEERVHFYGVKQLESKPFSHEEIEEGTGLVQFKTWLKEDFLPQVTPPDFEVLREAKHHHTRSKERRNMQDVRALFRQHPSGLRHALARHYNVLIQLGETWDGLTSKGRSLVTLLDELHEISGSKRSQHHKKNEARILKMYPLLSRHGLYDISQAPEAWLQYILLIDGQN